MKTLFVALTLLLASCYSNYSVYYLTPSEVVEAIATADEKLSGNISDLDEGIRQLRQEVMFMANMGLIEKDEFLKIRAHLLAADYYVNKSWVLLLEKSKDSQLLYDEGKNELKRASDAAVTALDKKNSL